jgi:hypothetical protein
MARTPSNKSVIAINTPILRMRELLVSMTGKMFIPFTFALTGSNISGTANSMLSYSYSRNKV